MTTDAIRSAAPSQGGVARWREVKQALEAEIALGRPAPGERLPNETQLGARFGVNRHTARRALQEMARLGLVRVEHGRGTFVSDIVLDYAVEPRTRFSEWVRRQNREPSGQVLSLQPVAADATVSANLGIGEGDAVVAFERLGRADGIPVSLATHYFAIARLPGIEAALAAAASVTAALAAVGVADYRRLSTRVSARMPSALEAGLLRSAPGSPLLVCENLNVDGSGAVVEYGVTRHPALRVQVICEP